LQLDRHLGPALVALPFALANTGLFLSAIFWGRAADRIGRRWAVALPAALCLPVAFLYLLAQDYT
jgi:MFS family permease